MPVKVLVFEKLIKKMLVSMDTLIFTDTFGEPYLLYRTLKNYFKSALANVYVYMPLNMCGQYM